MDSRERSLIQQHKVAAQHYRWAVEELRKRLSNDEDVTTFRRLTVTPARENCSLILRTWMAEYHSEILMIGPRR